MKKQPSIKLTPQTRLKEVLKPVIESIIKEARGFPLKYIAKRDYQKYNLEDFPNFSASGSISGMKKQYYGQMAKLVKCGSYIYNVSRSPEIYDAASDYPV